MSTALYRRYRPESFDEVIGQEHVTRPLSAAIDSGRINHAFLFSGPRGCGKTTSARILARCLNCEQGPTANPCGQCPSCRDLANDGPGSLDVVEIDAASHNGVDDARDLRERAIYAPARDRYKVFILDEAHMVTTQGFNALLKLVEEPPAHVKFVFATTEPDKVIGTIRSRTHHYPFRLVPPETLGGYLDELCSREGVPVSKGVIPLVVRAGGGSVRDTLSVLDQLMAGADANGVDYQTAVALLGYTDDSLLGDIVDAFSAGDGAGVFRVIDRVVDSGHDPRRFVEDLLERFRDLFVIAAAEDAAASFLPEVPADRLERLTVQARAFGPAELSRAADLLNAGLTEMTGATSPRLQLELICARILLPGVEDTRRSVVSRVDRLERRVGMSATGRMPAGAVLQPEATEPVGGVGVQDASPAKAADPGDAPAASNAAVGSAADADPFAGMADAVASARSVLEGNSAAPQRGVQDQLARQEPPAPSNRQGAPRQEPPAAPGQQAVPGQQRVPQQPAPEQRPGSDQQSMPAQPPALQSQPEPQRHPTPQNVPAPQSYAAPQQRAEPVAPVPQTPEAHPSPEVRQAPGTGAEIDAIRRGWPDVLSRLQQLRKLSYAIVSGNSFPQRFEDGVLLLAFSNPGSAQAFKRGPHAQFVASAVEDSLGIRAEVRVGDENAGPPPAEGGQGGGTSPHRPSPAGGPSTGGAATPPGADSAGSAAGPVAGSAAGPAAGSAAGPAAGNTAGPGPGGDVDRSSGAWQVTREQIDSVVGPREADKPPVDHERFWQSEDAGSSAAPSPNVAQPPHSAAEQGRPPAHQGREHHDDAEGDSPASLSASDDSTSAPAFVPAQTHAEPNPSHAEPNPSSDASAGVASADSAADATTGDPSSGDDPWAPVDSVERWSGDADSSSSGTTADGPMTTAAGEGAVDFGSVVVPPPVDIEPWPEDSYDDQDPYAEPDPYVGSDPYSDEAAPYPQPLDGPAFSDETANSDSGVNFLGAYADIDIAFTENPGYSTEPAASSEEDPANSAMGRYARLAQRHSGPGDSSAPPPPPVEEREPDPIENYTDYDTEGDADIEHNTEFGPAVVERLLGGVIIEEIDE